MNARVTTPVVILSMVVLSACTGGDDAREAEFAALNPLAISGGGTTGIYYSYGAEFAEVLAEQFDINASVLETGGSIENLRNLESGVAQIAFSSADAAGDAASGSGIFDEPIPVQAIGRVYDDFVHLIVPRNSEIRTLDDLRGRAVSLGAEGSGTELIARRLLEIANLDTSDMSVRGLGINDSIEALRAGEIDAFFWSGGLPTPGIDDLAMEMPIQLVPLDDVVESARATFGSGYRHGVVPEGTYGLPADVETMAVPNVLMVRKDLSHDAAYSITEALFEGRTEITTQVPAAAQLDLPKAIFTEPVDLHPGAVEYYRDNKT